MRNPYDYLFKIGVVGSAGAGKSALITRFVRDEYCELPNPKKFDYLDRLVAVGNKSVKLQVWNGKDQDARRAIYSRGIDAVIIVLGYERYTNKEAFIDQAIQEIDAELRERDLFYTLKKNDVFIVINKAENIDESDQQQMQQQLSNHYKHARIDSQIHFVSAKLDRGVQDLFLHVARKLKERLAPNAEPEEVSITPVLPHSIRAPQSREVNEAQGLITGFFADILKFIDRLAGAIIGGVFGGLALVFLYNPLAVFYETVETKKSLWKVIAPLSCIPMALIILVKGLGKSTQAGWDKGFPLCIGIPFDILLQTEYEEDEKIRYSHVFASWLVMGLTAAVVLAVLFTPLGLTLGLSAATVVGLGGVSTTALAVIAGVTAAIAGSLVYSLEYLWVNKDKTSHKKTRTLFSSNEHDGYGKRSVASQPPSSYAIVSSQPVAAGSNPQRRLYSGLGDASEPAAQLPASQSFATYSPVGLSPPAAASASSNPQRRMYSPSALFDGDAPASAGPRPGAQ